MRARRLIASCAAAGLLGTALAGCGSTDPAPTETIGAAVGRATAADSPAPLPDRVVVRQPALIDTNASPYDLPVWPGPALSGMHRPDPPAGVLGELSGQQARDVYAAAQTNPRAWWNFDGIVVWLVVDPLP